jgi:hypothetical protein
VAFSHLYVLYLVAGRNKYAGGQTYIRVTRGLDDDTSGLFGIGHLQTRLCRVSTATCKADEASDFTPNIKAGSAASKHAAVANKKAVPRPEIPPQTGREDKLANQPHSGPVVSMSPFSPVPFRQLVLLLPVKHKVNKVNDNKLTKKF